VLKSEIKELQQRYVDAGLKNIRLIVEYDGADYAGWQRQATGQVTVQSTIEDVLSHVLSRKVVIYGASRTDSGVHSRGQVANFWAEPRITPDRWKLILNDMLPRTIRVSDACEVPPEWHAQRNAKRKIYQYRVLNRSYSSALDRQVYFCPRHIDWEKIERALPFFIGRRDFKAFQNAKATVKTTEREIFRFELHRERDGVFTLEIEGSGFLKQMVRSIVGTLLEVGENKRTVEEIPEIIASCDRRRAGPTVPASGLCLVRVIYE
jgi:tRNA pseudouridine38-40 synthase